MLFVIVMYMQVIHIALASAGTNEPIDYLAFAYWKVLIGLHVHGGKVS